MAYTINTKIEQQIFIDTDEDDIFAVKYTITVTNSTADADAASVTVKAVLGENLSWYERDDDTDALYFIEDISDLTDVPETYDLDELAEYVENHIDSAKSAEEVLEPYASAVIWADQTIAAGEEEEYVFYASIAEGITTTDELPALYFVDGELIENTAEDQTIIEWKNEGLLAENETEAETETETEPETETETEKEAATESETEAETETEIETETETEVETEAETESETETETEAETETDPETETETAADPETETETATETESESEAETEEAYNFIVYEVTEGGEICLTYVDGYTETITPYMMSDDYDVEVNMPVTEEVEVSVTAYDGYAYVCSAVLDEEGNTIAAYDADTTAFTVTANADYKTTVQVTFAEDDEAYYFSEEMLEVASYEQLAAAAAEDDPDTLQGQINALLSSDTDSGISTASEAGIATAALVEETSSGLITLDDDYTEDLMIWDGVDVTIDLNGHTITSAGTGKNAITVYGTLTLTDSSADADGAVKNGTGVSARGVLVAQGASFTMSGGTISGFSVSGNGGGVSVENGGTFAMTGGTIDKNTATGYGGGVFLYEADQIASMTGGTISNNTAGLSGGGLAANQTTSGVVILLSGLTISGNTSSSYGGGFYFNNAITTLTISSTISGNTSTSEGGGVYFGAAVTTLNITDATIDGNTSGAAGGGVYFAVAVPTATICGSSISGNFAAGNGGGIWLNAGTSLTLEDSENNTSKIDNNKISAAGALFGGGIYMYSTSSNRSTFTSTGGEISGNIIYSTDSTNSYGGGICIGSTVAHAYASVNMSNTTVSDNSGATYGGGIAIYTYAQEATFTNLTVSGNKAVASAASGTGYGGGVYIAGNSACTVTVSGGTFSENSADYYGGGMYVTTATSSLVLQDAAKFDGNTSYNGGGGIYTEGYLKLAGGDSKDTAVIICSNVCTGGVGGGVYSSTVNSYAITSIGYVDVYENSAGTNGGGLCVNAGGMDLSGHITIHNNYSRGTNYGGAGLYAGSNTTGTIWLHDGVYIYDNTSNLHGGGVYARWGLKIDDGVYIYGNYANSNGGGVDALTLDMSGGEIHDNSAAHGGGVYIVQGTAGSVNPESTISGGKIYNNTARTGNGGGVYENSYPNILYIKGSVEIYDNSAYNYGGGVYASDLFTFSGGIITGNTAQRGGGVYIIGYFGQKATIEISGTDSGIIYDNTATSVNYGNDVALGYNSSISSVGDNTTGYGYPFLSMGAASTFTDTANDITGVSWYDEVDDTTAEDAFSTYITSSTQQAGQYYTLLYKTVDAAIAEIWNTEDNKYETFTSVQEAVDAVENDPSVYGTYGGTDDTITIIMLDNNREDVTIPTGVSVTLDLAGCTLTGLAKSVITVDSDATLVIDDSSTEGTGLITGGDGTNYCYDSKNSKYAYCGGGLLILGIVTFKGGTISGNVAANGGGVYVAGDSNNGTNGTFILDGGTITGNTATSNGGGLAVFSGYTSSAYKNATTPNFTMNLGSITANKGGNGGGVYVNVYVNVEITGGSITNNTCSSSSSVGGGMYISSQTLFNMTGGLITGNTAVTGGGIYNSHVSSNLTFSADAQIYGNTATSNVANDIYATITGGSISVLAASSMGNASYNSWFDSNGDDSSYPYYYTEEFTHSKLSSNHIFALTATNYSGGYVAYIAETTSGNTVYQIDNEDGTYSYTVEADTAAASNVSASAYGTAYATLQAAINAAVTGDTIYLLCDVEESLSITDLDTRTEFTIDLNGYTLFSTGDYGFYIKYANKAGMDITIRSYATDVFTNKEDGAVGTITVADSNSSSFPWGIYIPSGNVSYQTYLTVDSVLITGFGNSAQADASGSSTYNGAGIYTSSYNSVKLTGTTKISGNYAYQGGGVYMTGYNIYLTMGEDVIISGNTAYQGGGVCFNASGDGGSETDGVFTYKEYTETVTINGSEISGNTSVNIAGGLYITGWNSKYNTSEGDWPKVTITGATIKENTAGTEVGGAYLLRVSNATITGSYITDNYSTTQYGGMYVNASSTPGVNALYTITDSYFTGNTAGTNYSGLIVSTGVAKINNCTFTENIASAGSAALYLVTVADGSCLSNCTFTDNESTISGYIVYITSSYLDVSNMTVTGNNTVTNTGAVCIHANSSTIKGEVTIADSNISNNSGYGLDLYLQNDLGEIVTVTNTKINNNFGYGIYMRQSNSHYNVRSDYVLNIGDGVEVAYNGNTGIYANGYGTLNINGGKIHDNTGSAYGGGVHAEYTDFNMSGGEIYNNTATKGGGVYLVESANTYNGGTYSDVVYGQAATDTITGGRIYDNTATSTSDAGGGVYIGNYDSLVMTGGEITDNYTSGLGGGVYMSTTNASFELGEDTSEGTVGKIYGNSASLGQDIYAAYSDSSTSLLLISASSMLSSLGLGWLDETRETVTEDDIEYTTVKKYYALTLEYASSTIVAVIWNASMKTYDDFTSVQDAVDALYADKNNNTGYYYTSSITDPEIILVDDAVGNVEISGGMTLTINLNGYTLKGFTTAITCYGTLTIKDVQYTTGDDSSSATYCEHYEALEKINQGLHLDENNVTTKTGAGADESGAAYTGTITGTTGTLGGGIRVYSGGYVTMVSGQIANCSAGGTTKNNASYGGAGVYIESGTFVLSGTASINNCSTKSYGSAVYLNSASGTFILEEDAVITGNSSYYGTVYVRNGTFKMTGGSITGNTAVGNTDNTYTGYGGGVYMYAGTAKLTGGEISNNTATGKGGGIYINSGTVTLSGSIKVTGNSVTGTSTTDASVGGGGGIYMNSGTLNIRQGVEITGNTAIRGGGIYQYNGTINMSGGQITGNMAEYGGGLVQYPTYPGTFIMTGGVLCDNTSNLSSAGNDIYSITESDYEYASSGVGYPTATLIHAADMDYTSEKYDASYNVWKDDNYTGTVRTGTTINSGQYITASIVSSYGLQLTAEKYGDATATETTETTYMVKTLALTKIVDGTATWDSAADGAVTAYKDAATGVTLTDGTTWDNTSADNPLAAEWTAGNDSSDSNGLVRSYDRVTYSFTAYIEDSASTSTQTEAQTESGTGSQTESETDKQTESETQAQTESEASSSGSSSSETIKVYLEVTLPLSTTDAEYYTSNLDYYEAIESDDGKSQTILGYFETTARAGTETLSISFNVKGMTNGSLLEPTFKAWIDGNSSNEADPAKVNPTAVTISAAGMYDITLLRNTELSYTGYFDLSTGEETTKDAYVLAQAANDDSIVYGTMLGYGITLSMRNTSTSKGKKGMESPTGEIEFGLTMTGVLYLDGKQVTDEVAPYVWAYKANENTDSGSSLDNTMKNVNMNWNDEDDVSSTTQYAYDAAPFNTGSNTTSCYSGGAWTATGSQPDSSSSETTVNFSVSGYAIDTTFGNYYPNAASDGTTTNFTGSYIKPFSAGYIQVIFPIDPSTVEGQTGYLSVGMDSIVSDLAISDSRGIVTGSDTSDPEADDLEFFVDWYGEDDYKEHATCEVTYLNNYVYAATGLYVTSGEGESLTKTNYFNNASNGTLSGQNGSGTTSLGSVVYIGSDVSFGSNTYDTTDKTSVHYNKEFDAQEDNAIEYDYLTAVNLLQKFDAKAYTPASTTLAVVNQTYTLTTQTNNITDASGNTIFRIKTSEASASWSTTKTMSYTLTILYAAKKDGSNWTYAADDYGYDSPVPEMDETTEEDLIYFTTLQDLYDYFGGDGVCVGILYEFRDCCIRNGRSISVTSRMEVTDEFENTGKTFCTTNDVRGWTTYRPVYKKALTDGALSEQLFNFTWYGVSYGTNNGKTAYGTATGSYPDSYTTAYNSYSSSDGGYTYTGEAKLKRYDNGYVKTEYEDGWMVSGTHTGWYSGNTLLLYTMESGIDIEVADIIEGSAGTPKTQYSLGSERTASFVVTPTIAISSGVGNELVTNGTQSTVVEITISLPNHLNFDEGSLTFDYTNSDYAEGDLTWEIVYTKSDETDTSKDSYGTATLVLTTTVTDISKVLPTINYTCTIGTPGAETTDPDEAQDGESLTTIAEINCTYEESGQISTYAKKDNVVISVIRKEADSIWIEADGKLELGQNLVYNLYYSNRSDAQKSVEIGTVLPYVGDGRDTSFSGGYQVTGVTLTFDSYETWYNFLTYGALIYSAGEEYSTDSADQIALLNRLMSSGTALYTGTSYDSSFITTSASAGITASTTGDSSNGPWTISFDLTTLSAEQQKALTQLASTQSGIAFYAYLNGVQVNNTVEMSFTLSPYSETTTQTQTGTETSSSLIVDGDDESVQEGGDVYMNSMFYRLKGQTTTTSVNSNIKKIKVIERTLSGIAWLDQDNDGYYSTASGSTDQPLEGIEVYLYTATPVTDQEFYNKDLITVGTNSDGETTYSQTITTTDDNGKEITETITLTSKTLTTTDDNGTETKVTLYPAIDVLGNLVAYQTTDNDGAYSFENLASGTYYVVFTDEGATYTIAGEPNSAPLPYEQLSVTTTYSTSKSGTYNHSSANYVNSAGGTSSGLVLAEISGISMPALAEISGSEYALLNMNSSYDYVELNVEKIWENMLDQVDAGTEVTFTVTGTSTDTSQSSNPATNTYTNTYVLTQETKTTNTSTASGTGVVEVTASDGTVTAENTGYDSSDQFRSITVTGTDTEQGTSVSGEYAAPSLSVEEAKDTDTGLTTITWSLGSIALQKADSYGTIEYKLTSVVETETVEDTSNPGGTKTQALTGFVMTSGFTTDSTTSPVTYTATATNTQILYELQLYKISTSSDGQTTTTSYISNAEFTLYTDLDCNTEVSSTAITTGSASATSGADASSGATSTDTENGKLYIGQLAAGTYYLKETVAPSGYELNKSVWKIDISYVDNIGTGNSGTWTTTPVISVTLVKDKDGNDSNTPLGSSNVSTGSTTDFYVSPEIGSTSTLYTVSFQMEDEIIYSLPQTGSIGIIWPTLAGVALMLAALVMNERKRWKAYA
ncbi:MAG: LPXTG cell wall anchor domain-containing protein [Clostridiales bacterium]|nr:LPXTG cell wall anchor domain-containing protein [Clostridiales bacterium]